MKVKEGYKVIHCCANGQRISCVRNKMWSTVFYIFNEFVKPREGEGPLAVFNTLQNAKSFTNWSGQGDYDKEIWKCKYEPSTSKNLFTYKCSWFYGKRKSMHIDGLPPGTKLARRVKLLKKVG